MTLPTTAATNSPAPFTIGIEAAAYELPGERQDIVLQALEEVGAMLQSLSPKAARAFTLAVVCEMTDDEVGAALQVSGRMVRKYVAQAMLGCLSLRARETALALRAEPGG